MPFNGSGTFSIVNTFVPNTTILSAAVNQNFTDIATGLSDVLTRDGQAGMTAALKAISGSVSAPGITFNSDATSGLFLSSSGIVGLVSHSLGMLLNTELFLATSATVQAGGSGYAIGDTITVTGGTAVSQAVYAVATLSGTAVATVTVAYSGFYSVKPTNPVSQGSTSGIGTGCTLNVTYNDPSSSDYRAFFSDQSGGFLWNELGASTFVSGLMNKANALAFATGIGSAAIAQVLGGTFLLAPQGVLSPISSTTNPVSSTDTTAATTIYWTPLGNGNGCPIYNGTSFVQVTTAQVNCALTAGAQVLNGIYDIYMFLNSGTPALGLSPSWSAGTSGSVTAGSCARGTGAGGTALTVLNGLLVNTVAMTVNNGASTFSVAINQGTYLGSVYINAVAGQYNCHVAYGQSRVWGLWNMYNRRPILLKAGDGTGSWTGDNTLTFHAANKDSNNKITAFNGYPVEDAVFTNAMTASAAVSTGNTVVLAAGVGFNSTSAASGKTGQWQNSVSGLAGTISSTFGLTPATFITVPSLGINVVTALENSNTSTTNITMLGTEVNFILTANYRG